MASENKLGKLQQAINLTQKPQNKEECKNYNSNLSKGIGLFNGLCLRSILTPDDKLDAITAYLKCVPDGAADMLMRWRDTLPFLNGSELVDMVTLLSTITRTSDIESHERLVTAVTLYNRCFLNVCYQCFADIACDRSVLVKYRVDASRYLFASESDDFKAVAKETLIEIIDTQDFPSEFRYNIIASFISKSGISSMMNMSKIRVPYDEIFVYALQTTFFREISNGPRERILSGQHLLQMDATPPDEKKTVVSGLFSIAQDEKFDEDTKADAADVIMRLSEGEDRSRARDIVTALGYSSVGKKGPRTIYDNSQNIHEFTEQITSFLEKIIGDTSVKLQSYHEVYQEVSECVRKYTKTMADSIKAFKSLNRINIDTAKFTKYKIGLDEIFVHVWIRIKAYGKEERITLENRLVEELVDMSGSCSRGHSGRFVNVLSYYDTSLRISWSEQIHANVSGRMLAKIRDHPDSDTREKIAMAKSDLADDDDRATYAKFMGENIPSLRDELYEEFVNEGYISEQVFSEAFEEGIKDWE